MKYLFGLISILLFFGCNDEDAPGCFKRAGDAITMQLDVESFERLEINDQFNVVIEQGPEQLIFLDYFQNLVNDIELKVEDRVLKVSDNNSCQWVRDYNFPVLRITHPNLDLIRQNGGGLISSSGVLRYERLYLISEDRTGDFRLTVDNKTLQIVNNDLSNYYIDGKTEELNIGFFSGDGRFEGQNLVALNTMIFHRATNDIIVNTQNSLSGRLLSTGNLIFVSSTPSNIDISVENRGKLIDRTN